jgi:C_GCAxxG_C_C family probable redox protein
MDEDCKLIRAAKALEYFDSGFNCAQSIAAALSDKIGIDEETALKMAAAYGFGIANTGETCGAITGALMIIGLKYGGTSPDDTKNKQLTFKKSQEFLEKFKVRNQSTICRELLSNKIDEEEGNVVVNTKSIQRFGCSKYVLDAVEILEIIL